MELNASNDHKQTLIREMYRRFRKLGTPMSNQICFSCALSISALVGATSSCRHPLDAPNNNVLRIFMITCTMVSVCLTTSQLPVYKFNIPSLDMGYFTRKTMVDVKLISRTVTAIPNHMASVISRLECQVRQVFARG